MVETSAVARAISVPVSTEYGEQVLRFFSGYPPWARTSMLLDVEAGRRLELEALNGTAVRLGKELGVQTPLNFAVYAALKPYVNGAPVVPTLS